MTTALGPNLAILLCDTTAQGDTASVLAAWDANFAETYGKLTLREFDDAEGGPMLGGDIESISVEVRLGGARLVGPQLERAVAATQMWDAGPAAREHVKHVIVAIALDPDASPWPRAVAAMLALRLAAAVAAAMGGVRAAWWPAADLLLPGDVFRASGAGPARPEIPWDLMLNPSPILEPVPGSTPSEGALGYWDSPGNVGLALGVRFRGLGGIAGRDLRLAPCDLPLGALIGLGQALARYVTDPNFPDLGDGDSFGFAPGDAALVAHTTDADGTPLLDVAIETLSPETRAMLMPVQGSA